jgi:hypothetical protein
MVPIAARLCQYAFECIYVASYFRGDTTLSFGWLASGFGVGKIPRNLPGQRGSHPSSVVETRQLLGVKAFN